MSVWLSLLLLALPLMGAVQAVKTDQPLRSGCAASDKPVAQLKAGEQVDVKFALSGEARPCYLVTAKIDGRPVDGYLFADSLSGAEEFDRQRRAAAPVISSGGVSAEPAASRPELEPSRIKVEAIPLRAAAEVQRAMDLMQANQPGQAQQILEKLLKQFPQHPGLLSLAGLAAYRADDVRSALAWWRESLDLKPNPGLEDQYKRLQREMSADRSTDKKFGMRFLLRYDGTVADSETATAILQLLDQEFGRVSAQLGCRAEERITTIVQSRAGYFGTTGAAEWSGGLYDGKIRVPLIDKNRVDEQARRTFAHEIVHACLANLGQWPMWLHEGLAQKLSGKTMSANEREELRGLAKSGKMPKLDQLGRTWGGKSTAEAHLAYQMALSAVDLFFEHHQGWGIRNLLNNPESLRRVTDDLDKRLQAQ